MYDITKKLYFWDDKNNKVIIAASQSKEQDSSIDCNYLRQKFCYDEREEHKYWVIGKYNSIAKDSIHQLPTLYNWESCTLAELPTEFKTHLLLLGLRLDHLD